MRQLRTLVFSLGLSFVALHGWAESTLVTETPAATRVLKNSHHHVGLGLSGFIFLRDLSDQFGDTLGPTASYEFSHPLISDFQLGLTLRGAYYNARKDGYDNVNVLFTPAIKFYYTALPERVGAILGLDVNYWKQSKTYIQRQDLHEDLLYGLLIGVLTETDLGKWGHVEYLLGYHMLQYSFETAFLELGVQYVWDF